MQSESKLLPMPMCPSAQPDLESGVVIGVVSGTAPEPRIAYLERPVSQDEGVLGLASPAKPTEVFRLASPCATISCQHFDGSSCRLVSRIVQLLKPVVGEIPRCHLRPTCRWWAQEGAPACVRRPQIVTELYGATPEQVKAAQP